MKTLDEVIEALDYCVRRGGACEDCPAFVMPDCMIQNDALHYLKVFRRLEDEMNDLRREAIKDLGNPALTWDELKQMVGKPVWYEHEFWKGWIILGKVEQGVNCEMIPDREERWYIVKDGSAKAYRKERE